MKKWLTVLLALCLLTGCAAPAAGPVAPGEEPPSETPETAEACSFAVELTDWSDSALDEDGTVLAEYTCRLPELTVRRTDGTAVTEAGTEEEALALETAALFNSQFASVDQEEAFRELADMAREDRDWRQESGIDWGHAYFTEMTCEAYQTEGLVSVAGDYYTYTGGAHPNTVLMAWNFDLAGGMFLEPEALAEDAAAFTQAVQEEIVRQIHCAAAEYGMTAEELYWESYEDIAAGWTSYAVSFDEEGMTVAFSPYELAAYAAGPQIFRLSYDRITPYLSEHGRELLGLEASEN